jgi:hypothetical protein
VAHTTRRSRGPEPAPPVTDAQIAAALATAVERRRRTAGDPGTVRAIPMGARDAMRATDNWRQHGRRGTAGCGPAAPWVWVGWVCLEAGPWRAPTALGQDRYRGTWAVWLNAADGRVWLRFERQGRFADAGDPYP